MHDIFVVGIVALVTLFTRAFPFVFLSKKGKEGKVINYLGTMLPSLVMAILIIYCLKDINFNINSTFIPQFISIMVVVALQLYKRNNLLSIGSGTICYMILIQTVFR